MSNETDTDRLYRRLLEEFSAFVTTTQEDRRRRDEAMAEMSSRLNIYWQATAAGLRQLSEWMARDEDRAQTERDAERKKRSTREWVIIGLLLVVILGGAIVLFHFW